MFPRATGTKDAICALVEGQSVRVDNRSSVPTLARLLLLKAACELLFVIALVAGFVLVVFTPRLEGHVKVDSGQVSGLIFGTEGSDKLFDVQLFIDGTLVAHRFVKCQSTVGATTTSAIGGDCGFSIEIPELQRGEHEVRVYTARVEGESVRRVLHLLDEPQRFVSER